MPIKERNTSHMLWFDVEKRYKTMFHLEHLHTNGCGLM